ncbi:hypothetical protein BJX99DRAFT_155029 [Aspergillus californicus]
MPLLDLPPELLALLPHYIDNIESFTSASSTCRTLHNIFSSTNASTILRLAASSSPTFFSPHPYFLIAATASSLRAWATQNETNKSLLRTAFHGGIYALYQLCLEHGTLTLDRIRETHRARFSIINPLSDKIDKMAGRQWQATPDFWNGGVSDAVTLYTDSDRAAYQIIIYGELFGGDFLLHVGLGLEGSEGAGKEGLDLPTRMDYLAYCLADDEEPYNPDARQTQFSYYEDKRSLRHILKGGRWKRMWESAVREFLDVDFEMLEVEEWRKKLLLDALMAQGLEGMQLVTCKPEDVVPGYLEKVRRIKDCVLALEEPPKEQMFGKNQQFRVSELPDPEREVHVCYVKAWRS